MTTCWLVFFTCYRDLKGGATYPQPRSRTLNSSTWNFPWTVTMIMTPPTSWASHPRGKAPPPSTRKSTLSRQRGSRNSSARSRIPGNMKKVEEVRALGECSKFVSCREISWNVIVNDMVATAQCHVIMSHMTVGRHVMWYLWFWVTCQDVVINQTVEDWGKRWIGFAPYLAACVWCGGGAFCGLHVVCQTV